MSRRSAAPGRLRPGARLLVAAALAGGALAACGGGAGQAGGAASTDRSAAQSTDKTAQSTAQDTAQGTAQSTPQTTTTTPAPTTTTPALPPDPQPSAEQAAATFMQGWMAANRAESQSVATPAAVDTLFATAYAGQPLNNRGCTDAFPPLVCTWGPYAYGQGSIYQVQVVADGSRWYVSAVTIEA